MRTVARTLARNPNLSPNPSPNPNRNPKPDQVRCPCAACSRRIAHLARQVS